MSGLLDGCGTLFVTFYDCLLESADFKSSVLLVSSSCYCLFVSVLYRRSISRLWEKQIVHMHVFLGHLLLSVRTNLCSNLCVSLDIANIYFYVRIVLEVAEVTE